MTARGAPQGDASGEDLQQKALVASRATDPPLQLAQPQITEHQGNTIVALRLPPDSPFVCGIRGRYLLHTDAGTRPMSTHELRRLVLSRRPERFVHPELNQRQRASLDYLRDRGRITNSDYQTLAPFVSSETIRRDLADMVENNILIKVGSKRATYYILK